MGITLGCGDSADQDRPGTASATAGVVGGWAATDAQIFATVEIRRVGASRGFCSGTLISPRIVVTAAHCAVIEPEQGLVRTAAPRTLAVVAGHLASDAASEDMFRLVTEVRVHEEYDHDFIMGRSNAGAGQGGIGSPNDIALLLMERPFDHIPVAPLLTPERELDLVRHGDVGFVAGYGVYDLDEGSNGELYISDAIIDIIGARELLTRRSDQLGDSCFGDSGGPLYVPTEQGDFLVGLVSRGRSDVKRECGDGGVYTLLSAHLPWITQTAQDEFEPALDSADHGASFLAEDMDAIQVPKGGSLRRSKTCAAADIGTRGHAPVWAFGLLVGLMLGARRLSRL